MTAHVISFEALCKCIKPNIVDQIPPTSSHRDILNYVTVQDEIHCLGK